MLLIEVLQVYFKQEILDDSIWKFVKNEEITYPDGETRRNEPKWENPLVGLGEIAELSLFKPGKCTQKLESAPA